MCACTHGWTADTKRVRTLAQTANNNCAHETTRVAARQGKLIKLYLHPSSMDWYLERRTIEAPESFPRLWSLGIVYSGKHNQLNALLGLLVPPRFPALRSLKVCSTCGHWDGAGLTGVRIPLHSLEIYGTSDPSDQYDAITSLQSLTCLKFHGTEGGSSNFNMDGAVATLGSMNLRALLIGGFCSPRGLPMLTSLKDLTVSLSGWHGRDSPVPPSEYNDGHWLSGELAPLSQLTSLTVSAA